MLGYHLAYVRDENARKKSASGGIATYISEYLLKNNKIDVIIHAKMIEGKTGEQHYKAVISKTIDELNHNRRSFYCAISFDKVLEEIKKSEYEKVLVIGTPCVIRGISNLLSNNKEYSHIEKVYTIALACSHNVNGMFTDYLAESLNIEKNVNYKVDLRNKDNIKDANNFNNHFFTENKTIKKMNRFESEFTEQWRNYSFSMNVCNACSDFWGYRADISVKDAWGKWSSDPLGQSIVIIRNKELGEIFKNNDDLYIEPLTKEEIIQSQKDTVKFKQYYARKRVNAKRTKDFNKISFTHRVNAYMRKKSIKEYNNMKIKGYNKKLIKTSKKITLIKRIYNKMNKILNKILRIEKIKNKLYKIKRIKNIRKSQNKILVVGGYGYQNVGDEAQLNVVIQRLKNCFPNFMIKILTPDIEYTLKTHKHMNVGEAPRIAFFKEGVSPLYNISNYNKDKGIIKNSINYILKILFLIKSYWIQFNAYLVKIGWPTFLLSPSTSALLYDIRTSKMIYFEGGGYLTGKTLSRLWDGILLCRIAHIYNIPVVMSGQTIGVWNTSFNKRYAKTAFKKVKLITVRDPKASLEALKEIGVEGDNIYAVCDDALFCSKENNTDIINKIFQDSNCDNHFRKNGYVAFNMHYWGILKKEKKEEVLKQLNNIIKTILEKTQYNILLIPMIPSDEQTMKDYMQKYADERIRMLIYDYDFNIIRTIISQSKICITMKHHPIIFSVGEKVPVISLNLSDYYEHKNRGAMEILGVEKYSITLTDKEYYEKFVSLFNDILTDYNQITKNIEKNLNVLKQKTMKFEGELTNLIERK